MTMEARGKSMRLVEWLAMQVGGIHLDSDIRTRTAAVCFGVAQEHHAAMVTLLILKQPMYASVFALARPLFEAYVRGMWLALCATDEQVDRYLEGKIPDAASLITALEKQQGGSYVSNLRKIYKSSWRSMSGMTHAGAEHLSKWSNGQVLEPAYTDDDIGRILDFAARVGVLATAGLALLAKKEDVNLWRRVLDDSVPLMPPRYDAPPSDGQAETLPESV